MNPYGLIGASEAHLSIHFIAKSLAVFHGAQVAQGTIEQVQVIALSQSQDNVQKLTQGIVDAETGSRGFLLTGNREYLQPYEQAQGKIDKALDLLGAHFGAQSESAAALDKLRDITRTRLSELASTIHLPQQGTIKAPA